MTFWWKYFWNTWSAAGAAATPPWPPFRIIATTTIFLVPSEAQPDHQASSGASGVDLVWAVPVLPQTSNGVPS